MFKEYIKPNKQENFDLFYIICIFSLLFLLTYIRFIEHVESFLASFLLFFFFFSILLYGRLIVLKLVGYYYGVQISLYQTKVDRYFLRSYDRISSNTKGNLKAIPSLFISLFLYLLSFGLLIFPSVWNYKYKKIPHKFIGTRYKFEVAGMFPMNITNYRIGKILFIGYIYYFIFALIYVTLFSLTSVGLWLLFSLFWIALFSLIPLLGTEGYEIYFRNKFSWISALTILIISVFMLLVFSSFFLILLSATLISAIVILGLFIREVMSK